MENMAPGFVVPEPKITSMLEKREQHHTGMQPCHHRNNHRRTMASPKPEPIAEPGGIADGSMLPRWTVVGDSRQQPRSTNSRVVSRPLSRWRGATGEAWFSCDRRLAVCCPFIKTFSPFTWRTQRQLRPNLHLSLDSLPRPACNKHAQTTREWPKPL